MYYSKIYGRNFHHLDRDLPLFPSFSFLAEKWQVYWSEWGTGTELGQGSGHRVLLARWVTHLGPVSGHTILFLSTQHSAPRRLTGWVRLSWIRREVHQLWTRRNRSGSMNYQAKAQVWHNQIFTLDHSDSNVEGGFERQRLFRRWLN